MKSLSHYQPLLVALTTEAARTGTLAVEEWIGMNDKGERTCCPLALLYEAVTGEELEVLSGYDGDQPATAAVVARELDVPPTEVDCFLEHFDGWHLLDDDQENPHNLPPVEFALWKVMQTR